MTGRRWMVVALLATGLAIAHADRVGLSVAIAPMAAAFSLSPTAQGIALAAFFASYALLQVPAGWLVDRYGIRTTYALGFLIWTTAAAACALAGSFTTLVLLRLVVGAGEAVVLPASMRYIRDHFTEDRRGLAIGVLLTGARIGPAVVLPIAAALGGGPGWRWMFLLTAVVPLPWVVAYLGLLRRDDVSSRPRALISDVGTPDVPLRTLLGSPAIWGTIAGTFSYMYFYYFCVTWMPVFFQKKHGLSLEATGWYSGVSFAGMALMALAGGKAADALIARGFDPVVVRKSFTVAGLSLASLQTLSTITGSTNAMLFFSVFGLCALGLATANYWALTQALIPGGAVGITVGIQNTAASVAGIAAPAITGWLISVTGSLDAPIYAIGGWLLAGVAAYLFLVRRRFAPATAMSRG